MRHWYLSICMGGKYQCRMDTAIFSWWWAPGCPKHVEKRNKYIEQNCAPSWIYLRDYTGMQVNKTQKIVTWSAHKGNTAWCFRNVIHHGRIFQKSRSHIKILGARKGAWNKFHTENPQFCSDLCNSLLSDAFVSVYMKTYVLSYVQDKNCSNCDEYLVARGLVQPCYLPFVRSHVCLPLLKVECSGQFFFYCWTVHFDICTVHSLKKLTLFKNHINPLKVKLNPICHLLALLEARHILHVSGIRVKVYIKIHINIAPTYFGLRPSSGSLHWTWLKLHLC